MKNQQEYFISFFKNIDQIFTQNVIDTNSFNNYLTNETCISIGNFFLQCITDKHDFVPSFNPALESRITLFQTKLSKVELEILPPNSNLKNFVSNNKCKQLIGVLKGEATLKKFNVSKENQEITLRSQEIIKENQSTLSNNEYILIENFSKKTLYILYLSKIENNSLQDSVKPIYSIKTGKFSHILSNSLTSSRLEHMLFVMGHMKYKDCSEIVEKLAFNHKDYFIRWEAIRTFCKINPNEAEVFLSKNLTHEKHPHVLNAIKKSLFLIQNRNK